jgi:hypothetical protein
VKRRASEERIERSQQLARRYLHWRCMGCREATLEVRPARPEDRDAVLP